MTFSESAEHAWAEHKAAMLESGTPRRRLRRSEFMAGWEAAESEAEERRERTRRVSGSSTPLVPCVVLIPGRLARRGETNGLTSTGFTRVTFNGGRSWASYSPAYVQTELVNPFRESDQEIS